MTIHRIHSVSALEDRLKARFEKLMYELTGERITAQQARSKYFDVHESEKNSEFYDVNHLDLRLAIDDFSAIIKELKKFAKKP